MVTSTTEDLADVEERGQQHDHAGPVPRRVSDDDGRTWWYPVEIARRTSLPEAERTAWMNARIARAEAAEDDRRRAGA